MSAQIIPFPSWSRDKQTIDSEEDMVNWAIWTFCVERQQHMHYSFQQAAEFGRLLWSAQAERNLNESIEDLRRRLEVAIGRATCGWIFYGRGGSNHIRNFLRYRFNVSTTEQIPAEHLQEALDVVNSMAIAATDFHSVINQLVTVFERQVLGGGAPWTPAIKRKLRRDLGSNPNWAALAAEIEGNLT